MKMCRPNGSQRLTTVRVDIAVSEEAMIQRTNPTHSARFSGAVWLRDMEQFEVGTCRLKFDGQGIDAADLAEYDKVHDCKKRVVGANSSGYSDMKPSCHP